MDQLPRQLNGRRIGKTQQGTMADFLELVLNRFVENRVPVAVDVHPERGNSIQVSSSLKINEVRPLSSLDNERDFLLPFFHLGKRVPQILAVPISELGRGRACAHRFWQRKDVTRGDYKDRFSFLTT